MNREEDRDVFRKTAEWLDLPMDMVATLPTVEIFGDRQVFLSRHQGILSYDDAEMTINCGSMLVRLRGRGLQLLSMTEDEMRIGGVIDAVELAR